MSNLQKWSPAGPSFVDIFGTSSGDLNISSFVQGTGILGSSVIDNSSNGNLYCDISYQCTSISPSGVPTLGFYLLPQLSDGTTYADGDSATTVVANQPTMTHWLGTMFLRLKASSTQNAMLRNLLIPPGLWKFYFVNNSGVTLPSTGTVCKARFYAETNNG